MKEAAVLRGRISRETEQICFLRNAITVPWIALLLVGCDPGAVNDPVQLTADGTIIGVAFLDRNGNGLLETAVDVPVEGIRIALRSGGSIVHSTATAGGVFGALDLPVGTYSVTVDQPTVSDTLEVAQVDSSRVTISASDTAVIVVRLRYPAVTVLGSRSGRVGLMVMTEGVLLSSSTTFGDSTVHLQDWTAAIRIGGVDPGGFVAGDSVRVVARVGTLGSTPALLDPSIFRLGNGDATALSVSVEDARTARAGQLDAALVRVQGVLTRDPAATASGDQRFSVADGSGTLQVILDRDARIVPTQPLRLGAEVDLTGVLVPAEGGVEEWQLKPRTAQDVRVAFPLTSVEDARSAIGRYVRVRGTALNSGAAFPDGSVHLRGETRSIRLFPIPRNSVVLGDSIEVMGEIATLADGRPALLAPSISLLAPGPTPTAVPVSSTGVAAAADGGSLDASLVHLSNVAIVDTTEQLGQMRVEVNDGSGPLSIVILSSSGVDTSPLVPGRSLDVSGLLTPNDRQSWLLRVRSPTDIVIY